MPLCCLENSFILQLLKHIKKRNYLFRMYYAFNAYEKDEDVNTKIFRGNVHVYFVVYRHLSIFMNHIHFYGDKGKMRKKL